MQTTFSESKLGNTRARLLLVGRGILRVDKTQWQPANAFRCTIGVALPVILAILAGHASSGVLAGLGALYAGFASFRGVYRTRIRSMLLTIFVTSAATAAGVAVGRSDSASLATVGIVSFVAALYATSSLLANSLATQSVCVLIVLSALDLPPSTALANAGLVLGGGLTQLFLLTVVWPVNPRMPERKAVADVYSALAEFLKADSRSPEEIIPGTQKLEDARLILQEARQHRWRAEHDFLGELMRSSEAIRAGLVGFVQAQGDLEGKSLLDAMHLAVLLRRALRSIATKIVAGDYERLGSVVENLPEGAAGPAQLMHWYLILRGHLASVGVAHIGGLGGESDQTDEGGGWRRAFSFLTKLPDVQSLRNVALAHAIRYTLAVELAFAISRFWRVSHMYWLPLTVAIVLRADFATTVTRGAARLVGTLGGVLLATALMLLLHPNANSLGVLTLAATWFCFALFLPNYTAYSVAITLYVVFSVSSTGLTSHSPGEMRLFATSGGSAIAIAAYVLWPAFQGRQLRDVLREALDAQISFGEAVREGREDEKLEEARTHARQLRIRSETLYQTAALEPWGVSAVELRDAKEAILTVDLNAAELLALRVDQERDPAEVDRVLASSKSLRERLADS